MESLLEGNIADGHTPWKARDANRASLD